MKIFIGCPLEVYSCLFLDYFVFLFLVKVKVLVFILEDFFHCWYYSAHLGSSLMQF